MLEGSQSLAQASSDKSLKYGWGGGLLAEFCQSARHSTELPYNFGLRCSGTSKQDHYQLKKKEKGGFMTHI